MFGSYSILIPSYLFYSLYCTLILSIPPSISTIVSVIGLAIVVWLVIVGSGRIGSFSSWRQRRQLISRREPPPADRSPSPHTTNNYSRKSQHRPKSMGSCPACTRSDYLWYTFNYSSWRWNVWVPSHLISVCIDLSAAGRTWWRDCSPGCRRLCGWVDPISGIVVALVFCCWRANRDWCSRLGWVCRWTQYPVTWSIGTSSPITILKWGWMITGECAVGW